MPTDERAPLLGVPPIPTEDNGVRKPGNANEENGTKYAAPDGPRIPGVKLTYLLPALAIGVCLRFFTVSPSSRSGG